jgi:hypothetical protein
MAARDPQRLCLSIAPSGQEREQHLLYQHRHHAHQLVLHYRGTLLIGNGPPVGPYSTTIPRALWWPWGKSRFLSWRYPCKVQQCATLSKSERIFLMLALFNFQVPLSRFENVTYEYRGTSLREIRTPLGPHRRSMPLVLRRSQGGGRFRMGKVPLYAISGQESCTVACA